MMNKTSINITSTNIVVVVAFSLFGMLLWFYGCHRQVSSNNEAQRIFDTYYANSEYLLSGKVVSKELLYNYGSIYRNEYILEIAVDSFEIYKNDLKIDMPFLGVYDSITNNAYILSPLYNILTDKEYTENDSLPTVRISSLDKEIHFSDGLVLGMHVVEKSDALSKKEKEHSIRF